jgi:fatty acid desaturase
MAEQALDATAQQARYHAIEAEFEDIKRRYRAKLGKDDVAYTFLGGAFFLWLHRNLEAIEIGHNVLHGQYDYFPEIPQFHAHNFKWKAPVDEEGWRREHNGLHHVHTNVYEKDPDLNHGILRMNEETPWNSRHRFQVPIYLIMAYPFMLYHFNNQNLAFQEDFRARKFPLGNKGFACVDQHGTPMEELKRRNRQSILRVVCKEYVVFPLLALLTGFGFFKVFLGNLLADAINNYWISLTIQSTHLTEPLQPDEALQNKGHWYLTQLDSSVNFKGSRRMSILWGHLNYQIEHHLFPDIPSHRYPDIAKEVKAVCAKHNLPYKLNPTWWRAISNYVGAMWKYSKPPADASSLPQGSAS